MKIFARTLVAAAVIVAASWSPASAQLQPGDPGHLTWLYSQTRAAVFSAILAQNEFNVARASGDEAAMAAKATDLQSSLTEANDWTAALDRVITAGEHTEEVDVAVANLHGLTATAHDNLDELLAAGDLEGVGQALDESGQTFSQLSRDMRALRPLLENYL